MAEQRTTSTDTLVYEGIQKIFRNAVVRFIRLRLTDHFGPAWQHEITRLFAKEWPRIETNANELRSSGTLSTPIRDVADCLSVNHLYNIVEAHFAVLWPDRLGERELCNNLLSWARSVKRFRDPISHPGEAELSLHDAHSVLDAARRFLLYVDDDAAQRLEDLLDDLLQAPDSEPLETVLTVLPARETVVIEFVGRRAILTRLHEWFQDSRSRVWVLSGDGGKGKSAIAYTFAEEVSQSRPKDYAVVVWLSAKRRAFIEGEVLSLDTDFTDLFSCVNRILEAYGASPPSDREHASQQALRLLNDLPALLIVDDIDSLDADQEDAIAFLTLDVRRTKSKVLFTSRRELFGLRAATTAVSGMEHSEAQAFIRSRIRIYQFDESRFSDEAIARIIQATDGSPLYMDDLVRLCALMAPSSAIRGWEDNKGSAVREYAVRREIELLSDAGRRIVLGCALSNGLVTADELRTITGLSSDDVDSALGELRVRYLVREPSAYGDGVSFSLNRNTKTLVARLFGHTTVGRQIAAALERLGEPRGSEGVDPQVVALGRHVTMLVREDRSEDAEAVLLTALRDRHPENPRLLAQLAWLYSHWRPQRRASDARRYFLRAYQMGNSVPRTYVYWGRMELEEGELTAAIEATSRGMERCGDDPRLLLVTGTAVLRQAARARATSNEGRASTLATEAMEKLEKAWETGASNRLAPDERRRLLHELVRGARMTRAWEQLDVHLRRLGEQFPDDEMLVNERARRGLR
jgi:hypothetical protein